MNDQVAAYRGLAALMSNAETQLKQAGEDDVKRGPDYTELHQTDVCQQYNKNSQNLVKAEDRSEHEYCAL